MTILEDFVWRGDNDMKKTVLLIPLVLFISLAFGQSQNPCEDKKYLKIKKKTLDEMSEREYDYFIKIDEECKVYQQNNLVANFGTKTNNRFIRGVGSLFITAGALILAVSLDTEICEDGNCTTNKLIERTEEINSLRKLGYYSIAIGGLLLVISN